MVRIVSDTSTMYSTQQAREAGFDVSALSVTIAGESYREFDEIMPDRFVEMIGQGHMPTSSQPAVGDVAALYEKYPDDEILNITMALGLSGTYTGAVAAAGLVDNPEQPDAVWSSPLSGGEGSRNGKRRTEQGRNCPPHRGAHGERQELSASR